MSTWARIAVRQGDTVELLVGPVRVRDPITQVLTPVDLSAGGTQMRFTAKAQISDADNVALIRKDGGVSGGLGGIALNSPVSTDKNVALITILPADTDAITALPVSLLFDVQLVEPAGRKTTIADGELIVVADVTNA